MRRVLIASAQILVTSEASDVADIAGSIGRRLALGERETGECHCKYEEKRETGSDHSSLTLGRHLIVFDDARQRLSDPFAP